MGGITDSMDVNLSKLQEIVKNRGAWCLVAHGVADSDVTEQLNNNGKLFQVHPNEILGLLVLPDFVKVV